MSEQNVAPAAGAPSPDLSPTPPPPQKQSTPRWLLPVLLILGALLLLNLGLYFRLSQRAPDAPSGVTAPPPTVAADSATPTATAIVTAPPASAAVVTGATPPEYAAAFVEGALPADWQAFAGEWRAVGGELVQQDAAGFDQGIVYTARTFGDYVLATRLRLIEGAGAGVLFNLPQVGKKNGGHLVRFTDDGAGLFWGYFDADGIFTGQGFAGVGAPGAGAHDLEVQAGVDTYAIRLDGQTLAEGIPLHSSAGYAGLITNRATAAFSAFATTRGAAVQPAIALTVTPVTPTVVATATPTTTEGVLNLEAISGEWLQEGDSIYQLKTAGTDYSLSTGIAGERYRLVVSITMTDSGDLANMGAGLLFHMPDRTESKGAQLVRFVNAGKGLAWGSFDAAGAFQGDGYVDLNLAPGAPHLLALTVDGATFAVVVDDQPIVQDIPAVRDNGWLALTTFRGPVEFKNMQIQLGSIVK